MPANNTLKVFPTLQYFGQNSPLFPQVNFTGVNPYTLNNVSTFVWRQLNMNSMATVSVDLTQFTTGIKFLGVFNQDPTYSQTLTYMNTTIAGAFPTFPAMSLVLPPGGFVTTCATIDLSIPLTLTGTSPNSSLAYVFIGA